MFRLLHTLLSAASLLSLTAATAEPMSNFSVAWHGRPVSTGSNVLAVAEMRQPALINIALADKSASLPYRIQWPAGWELTQLPSPETNSGKNLGGGRARAVRMENGGMVAAIELTYLPRRDNGRASLSEEFESMVEGIQAGYEKKHLKATLRTLPRSEIGGHAARMVEISISSQENQLTQWIGMVFSPSYVYSLTYTAVGENFSRFHPVLDALAKGMQLQ